jgi:hypothetical protein
MRSWFVQDAITARGYTVFAGEDDPEPEPDIYNASDDPAYEPPAGSRRSPRSEAAALNAIADAMGVGVADLTDLDVSVQGLDEVIQYDLSDPAGTYRAIAEAQARDGGTTWRAEVGAFMAEKGLTRRRSTGHLPPSRTPEARRKRHLKTLVDAGKYPDLATAEAMTQRRGGNRRPLSDCARL